MFQMKEQDKIPEDEQRKVCLSSLFDKEFKLIRASLYSSVGKESACSAGDPRLIPGSGRTPGEGNGNPLQYSYLENPVDRGAWWAAVHEVTKSLA